MANQWLRLWHDMPNDPKWRTISRISGVSVSIVQSVWIQILVSASQNEERGVFSILDEDIASALNEDEESVAAVINAMQGRVLDGKKLTGWEQRQPSREDGANGGGKSPGSNYVYYVVDTERDVVKVGISRNPWARVKDIQVGSPSKIELIATMKTNARSERAIHSLFQKTRLEGEWFMRSEAINLLISKTLSKEVDSIESAINFLSSLPDELFLPTVDVVDNVATTKDKEEIKRREDLKDITPHNPPRGREPKKSYPYPEQLNAEAWEEWKAYRRENRFKAYVPTERSEGAAITNLINLSGGDHQVQMLIVQQSMANGWKGLFDLKASRKADRQVNDENVPHWNSPEGWEDFL